MRVGLRNKSTIEHRHPRLLSEFLELPVAPAWREDIRPVANAPKYHKLVSDDLRQVIENYDEVAAHAAMQQYL